MSEEVKQYKLGIIAPRSFTDYSLLEDTLAEKLPYIRHIVGNGVDRGGKLVEQFADNHKITKTIYPITAGEGGVFRSNWSIIKYSDFIYIFDDGQSKNTKSVSEECVDQQKKYKIIPFIPETNLSKYAKALTKIEKIINNDKLQIDGKAKEDILNIIKGLKPNEQNQTVSVES